MKSGNRYKIKTLCHVIIVMLLLGCTTVVAAETEKVAVLPFTMNTQQDLSFLQKGIVDMLSSRIANSGNVEVISRDTVDRVMEQAGKSFSAKGDLDETKARIIGANLGVDYILYGSLTLIGESTSLDAAMVDVGGVKETVTFFRQSTGLGSVIPQVNEFAAEINRRVFDRDQAKPVPAAGQDSRTVSQDPAFRDVETPEEKSSFISLRQNRGKKSFQKLAVLKGTVACLATGDVDNDGTIEVVTASDREIVILQAEGSRLVAETTLSLGMTLQIAGIDVADINGNGVEEIFVSCTNSLRNGVNSVVYEFNGRDYVRLVEGESFYYRVVKQPDGSTGKRLIGQEQAPSAYRGDFFEMSWKDGRYVPGEPIPMARNANVLGMSTGDVYGTGEIKQVVSDSFGKLNIVSSTGKREWKGSDRMGGSMLYFLLPRTDPDGTLENREYYPSRLMLYDMDGNGTPEVVCIKNYEMAGEMLTTFRQFTKGNIEVLSWDGLGLTPVYRTGKVAGQIGDFDIADIDGDGEKELVVTVITQGKGLIWTQPRSAVIMYPLD